MKTKYQVIIRVETEYKQDDDNDDQSRRIGTNFFTTLRLSTEKPTNERLIKLKLLNFLSLLSYTVQKYFFFGPIIAMSNISPFES